MAKDELQGLIEALQKVIDALRSWIPEFPL